VSAFLGGSIPVWIGHKCKIDAIGLVEGRTGAAGQRRSPLGPERLIGASPAGDFTPRVVIGRLMIGFLRSTIYFLRDLGLPSAYAGTHRHPSRSTPLDIARHHDFTAAGRAPAGRCVAPTHRTAGAPQRSTALSFMEGPLQ
jgi:hypothetical protein